MMRERVNTGGNVSFEYPGDHKLPQTSTSQAFINAYKEELARNEQKARKKQLYRSYGAVILVIVIILILLRMWF